MSDLLRDCTGYELAVGSVVGMRYFGLDRLGRLGALSYHYKWRPGVNVAVCAIGRRDMQHPESNPFSIVLPSALTYTHTLTLSVGGGDGDDDNPPEPPKHEPPVERCGCGFWAFTDSSYAYGNRLKNVVGVVSGFGRTLIGQHGFRCERAEIKALAIEDGVRTDEEWTQYRTWYGRKGAKRVATETKIDRADQRELVSRLYRGIPLYASVEAMLAEHPLSQVPDPDPERDPDFWERP